MPRCWLTTHWPPEKRDDQPRRHLYLRSEPSEIGADVRPGDWVLIFELRTGPARVVKDSAGKLPTRVPKVRGARAIVSLGTVATEFREVDVPADRVLHAYGREYRWKWRAETPNE